MTDSREKEDKDLDSRAEQLIDAEDDYESAMRSALALMEEGLHLGGTHKLDRDALHDRKALRLPDPL